MAGASLSPYAALAMVVGTALATFAGWGVGGVVGAVVGLAMAGGLSAVLLGSMAARSRRGVEGLSVGHIEGLSPQQALTVASALVAQQRGESGPPVFHSELLRRVEDIEALLGDDPRRALDQALALGREHPRSPAALAAVARARFALGQDANGVVAVGDAVRYALEGGMNPMAAKLLDEFRAHRDRLELSRRHLERLARVLEVRGDTEGARWCRDRLEGRR